MTTNLQIMFSLITGDIYTILPDELKTMDEYQLPLKQYPKPSCNKCYGRFYISRNITHNLYSLCPKCSVKCLDVEKIKTLVVPSNSTQAKS